MPESYDALDKIYTLTWSMTLVGDEDFDLEDKPAVCEYWRKFFAEEPPPGITPIENIEVTDFSGPDAQDNLLLTIKVSLRDFINSSVEYGTDPYEILTDIKKAADQATTQLAAQYLADETQDHKIAMLWIGADTWPTKPAL